MRESRKIVNYLGGEGRVKRTVACSTFSSIIRETYIDEDGQEGAKKKKVENI